MRTKVSAFLLIFMVLFTIILPNNQLITRIKTNLTLQELESQDFIPVHQVTHPLPVTFYEGPDFLHLGLPEYKEHFRSNPTLNVLYLAHSPPAFS